MRPWTRTNGTAEYRGSGGRHCVRSGTEYEGSGRRPGGRSEMKQRGSGGWPGGRSETKHRAQVEISAVQKHDQALTSPETGMASAGTPDARTDVTSAGTPNTGTGLASAGTLRYGKGIGEAPAETPEAGNGVACAGTLRRWTGEDCGPARTGGGCGPPRTGGSWDPARRGLLPVSRLQRRGAPAVDAPSPTSPTHSTNLLEAAGSSISPTASQVRVSGWDWRLMPVSRL